MIDLSDDFASYHVVDSSANPLGTAADKRLYPPDDALRFAVETVTRTWEDWECARIIGTVQRTRYADKSGGLTADKSEHFGEVKVEETVTLLLVYRDGPPGSRKVKLVHPLFPWMSWTIDADDVKRPPAGARL